MGREMKNSDVFSIGVIPKEWQLFKNKYLFKNVKKLVGHNFSKHNLLSLTTKGIITKDIENPNGKLPESFETYQEVDINDIVICLFDLDVSAVFSGLSNYNGMISPAYDVFKCKQKIYALFAKYWFEMIGHDRKYIVYSKSLRKTINSDNFNYIVTIVPPIEEQQRIASFLDSEVSQIDSIIEKTKDSIEEYKKGKQSLITEAVTKGLDKNVEMKDSGIEWIGEIPKHWNVKKLKYLFEIKKDIAGTAGYDILSVTQSGLMIKDISTNEGQIAADYAKYQKVKKGDFVMNHMDLLTGWVDCSHYEGVTSPDYRVFCLLNPDKHSSQYFKYIFQSCYKNRVFYGIGQGVSNLGRWRLQADKFVNFYLPIPSKPEQFIIANFLDAKSREIDIIIAQKYKLIEGLESYKKSLIYEYVTGKRKVI